MATLDPFTTPALQPPAGIEPNLINPESLYPVFVATVTVCLCFTTFATAARLTVNLPNIRSLQLEDC